MRRAALTLLGLLAASGTAAGGPLTGIGNIDASHLELKLGRIIALGPTFRVGVGASRHAAAGEMSFGAELLVFRELPIDTAALRGSQLCGLLSCRDYLPPENPAFDPVLFALGVEGGPDAGAGGHVHVHAGYGLGPVLLGLSYVHDRARGEAGHALGPELTLHRRLTPTARATVLELGLRADLFVTSRAAFPDRVLASLRLLFDLI